MTSEVATTFDCEGDELVGILGLPDAATETGVIILVGGPQYRAGSHRQFVSLARVLSEHGYATLRFDYRGMGDSTGEPHGFEDVDADIRAAIDHLLISLPSVRTVVLWGLCDAASAAMMYAPTDPRVGGLVLANPWARGSESYAKTMLAHYYLNRLLSRSFWEKLGSRQISLRKSSGELLGNITASAKRNSQTGDFRTRMTHAMSRFKGPALYLICESDLTAREFEVYAQSEMCATVEGRNKSDTWLRFETADHTFSNPQAASEAAVGTLDWLRASFPSSSGRILCQGIRR